MSLALEGNNKVFLMDPLVVTAPPTMPNNFQSDLPSSHPHNGATDGIRDEIGAAIVMADRLLPLPDLNFRNAIAAKPE